MTKVEFVCTRTRPETILILDDNSRFLESAHAKLTRCGFKNIFLAIDLGTARALLLSQLPNIALVDIHLGCEETTGLTLIKEISAQFKQTTPVVLSANRTQEYFFKAARAGAVDFLVKGTHIDLCIEVMRLLDQERGAVAGRALHEVVSDLGYLRTFGLTRKEISVLTEFSKDFPRISVLAARIDQAPVQLRKIFSRIYEKLGIPNSYQLVRTLTICELFRNEN